MYYLYSLLIFLLSIFLLLISLYLILNDLIYLIDWEIMNFHSCSILMIILFDWMSLIFMSFVLMISSIVIFYSKSYMSVDKNEYRFLILVLLFIFSMMMMIISPNLISILLGWDGLGLISYCLVIYFQNIKSFNAGMLTVLTNRIGDVALLIGISWMLNLGSWNFYFYMLYMDKMIMNVLMFMVFLAAITKSAQIPFSSWLPAAMAAPTPVSALVHSSTLVTAGVYLLIRFSSFMSNTYLFIFLLFLGNMTMFMAGMGANFEMDLKKIIALSTLSQLGLMMAILSMGFYKLTFFHLLTHALFKALLFLCAGILIHNLNNFQDLRWAGGFNNQIPLTLMCFNISNLALCGMPFLAGFYSKDLILEIILLSQVNFIILFSTGLTVMYTFRLIYFCLINNNKLVLSFLGEDIITSLMLFILSLYSIFGGSILMWLLFPFPYLILLSLKLKLLIITVCMMGGLLGYFLFSIYKIWLMKLNLLNFFLINFFSLMWFMPYLSTIWVSKIYLNFGMMFIKNMEYGWSEEYGGGGMSKLINLMILNLFKWHLNYLTLFFIFMFMIILFFI